EQYSEIIPIPSSLLQKDDDDSDNTTTEVVYTFVLTDDGRDGLCCEHGIGNVQLYNGTDVTTANSKPLFRNFTQNMRRFVHSFAL
ncbi:MAG: hypothetical protein ACKVOK_00845, partial [Flavobacteriales bacterium]